MRAQRILAGAAVAALVSSSQVSVGHAPAPREEGATAPVPKLERLAQKDGKPMWGPGSDPDPGGLPGYRPNMPSAPAARPVMPEPRNAPMSRGTAPTDSDRSGSSKANEDKKKTEPK